MAIEPDLLDRLRVPHSDLSGDEYWKVIYAERQEAADEIARLRGEVDSWKALVRELEYERGTQRRHRGDHGAGDGSTNGSRRGA